MMNEVFKFAATLKEFPPRAFPPSSNPATVVEEEIEELKEERHALAGASKKAAG